MVELSDVAHPSSQEAMHISSQVTSWQPGESHEIEEIRKKFKQDLIVLLKHHHPNGISTHSLMKKFQQMFGWSPSRVQFKTVGKVWEVIYTDYFAQDIAIRGCFVHLKLDPNKVSKGQGVETSQGHGKKGVGLSTMRMPTVVHSQSGDPPLVLNRAVNSDEGARFGVKPISTERFEQKEIRINPVKLNPNPGARAAELESVARECIVLLSNANEFVSEERIGQLLLQRLGLRHIGEAQCQIQYVNQLSCVNEHLRLLSKVNMYIEAFIRVQTVSTLYELQECLTEFSPNQKDFSLLNIGPIQRLPLVYKYFSFPLDIAKIPEITTIDVLDHLKSYMDKYNKQIGQIEMEAFLNYMVEKYNVENAYILGVRIRSLPLAAQVSFTHHVFIKK